MLHKNFSRFFAVLITVCCLFIGCNFNNNINSSIYNKWVSSYAEHYEISESTFINDCYEGNNVTVCPDNGDETAGYIYFTYTKIYDWSKGQTDEPEDKDNWLNSYGTWYPLNEELIGKWYADRYKNLSSDSVSLSAAYKKADGKSAADTLEEAKKEFTVENGYFASFSECGLAQ